MCINEDVTRLKHNNLVNEKYDHHLKKAFNINIKMFDLNVLQVFGHATEGLQDNGHGWAHHEEIQKFLFQLSIFERPASSGCARHVSRSSGRRRESGPDGQETQSLSLLFYEKRAHRRSSIHLFDAL